MFVFNNSIAGLLLRVSNKNDFLHQKHMLWILRVGTFEHPKLAKNLGKETYKKLR